MEIYQGIILGILQGLTEFLPVSSSGHLVLGQIYFNITEYGLVFDASVHMGTLGAVFIVYFKDILEILKSLVHYARTRNASGHERNLTLAAAIIIGSVPTAIIGLVLKQYEHILFTSSLLVGAMLMVTGCLLWMSRHCYRIKKGEHFNSFKGGYHRHFPGFCRYSRHFPVRHHHCRRTFHWFGQNDICPVLISFIHPCHSRRPGNQLKRHDGIPELH